MTADMTHCDNPLSASSRIFSITGRLHQRPADYRSLSQNFLRAPVNSGTRF